MRGMGMVAWGMVVWAEWHNGMCVFYVLLVCWGGASFWWMMRGDMWCVAWQMILVGATGSNSTEMGEKIICT